MALVNFGAWLMLYKLENKNKHLTNSAKKILDAVVKNGGFVDGGIIVALAMSGIIALVVTQETKRNTVPKSTVVDQKPIAIDDKVYQCAPIRQRVIQYYSIEEKKTKPLPLPPKTKTPKKECQK